MSDIEYVVNTLREHGGTAAVTVAGLFSAKRLLGPTLDMVGVRLREIAEKRIENLSKISAKADKLAGDSDTYPHVRVTQRILNDATLYDDDLQQTYVAGMLAGSRNDDGSDDRPVFYLTVIDGLTASQLMLFHVLYSAVAQAASGDESINSSLTKVTISIPEVNANLSRLSDDVTPSMGGLSDLFALEHANLVTLISMEGEELTFMSSRVGALLFDWAHGFNDDDISQFGTRDRPDIGLPRLLFSAV